MPLETSLLNGIIWQFVFAAVVLPQKAPPKGALKARAPLIIAITAKAEITLFMTIKYNYSVAIFLNKISVIVNRIAPIYKLVQF